MSLGGTGHSRSYLVTLTTSARRLDNVHVPAFSTERDRLVNGAVVEQPALNIGNLSKRYGDIVALDNVSLEVWTGETFGLVGPYGAGKSTLINILCGVTAPDSGQIEFLGRKVSHLKAEDRKRLGAIPQEISLYGKLTGRENLELFGSLYQLRGPALKRSVDKALDIVGLADRQRDRVRTYSGGMKRRLNIAASILHSPAFILMDEPTVGIDPQSRNLIFEVIERLHVDGVTIVYTSHYMEEVDRLCNRIAILDRGKVIACGTKNELMSITGGKDTIEVRIDELDEAVSARALALFPDMQPTLADGRLVLIVESGDDSLGDVISQLTRSNIKVKRVEVKRPSLEQVFLSLTGKELRD